MSHHYFFYKNMSIWTSKRFGHLPKVSTSLDVTTLKTTFENQVVKRMRVDDDEVGG